MKRLLPLAFALVGVAVSLPRLSAQRPLFTSGTAAEIGVARSIGLDRLRVVAAQKAIDASTDLTVSDAHIDRQSMAHVRVQQQFHGIPVLGGEAISHLNADGSRFAETDDLLASIDVSTSPSLSVDAAVDIAVADYGCRTCLTESPSANLWIVRDRAGVDHLTYRVQLVRLDGTDRTALPVRFIDAHSGFVVLSYDNLQTAAGHSLYSGIVNIGTYHNPTFGDYVLENLVRRVGTFQYNNNTGHIDLMLDADDTWDSPTQRAAVDAHYAMERYFSYLSAVHGRNGIDGAGGPFTALGDDDVTTIVASVVHFWFGYNNAFWSPTVKQMVYGDGDGFLFTPLVTLDIAGHEMTHGVTQYTAGLIYHGESGALNESWSDVFGAMLERHVRGESANTWLLAEEAYTPSIAGDALRYMDDPHRAKDDGFTADDQPDHYSERCTSTCPDTPEGDNGGVHINSGIANKAFYLVAKGGAHHLGGSMTGIGADAAARIWFSALSSYMTSTTDFTGARAATTLAAVALYGAGSPEHQAVARAWCLVGVDTCVAVDPVSISPDAGSGTTQTFTLQFSDTAGGADLSAARVRFATTSGQTSGSCSIWYDATTARIKLMDDGGAWGTGLPLGSGSVSNSQCTVNLASSTASANGNDLTLVLNLTFTGSFTGLKNIYMLAISASAGISSGWVQRGAWSPSGIAALAVTPNTGSGWTQAFTLRYADSQGATDLSSARVRFGSSNVGPGTCTAWYDAAAATIRLMDDAGAWGSPVALGSGTLSNSQCTLNLASSSATTNGSDLTLVLDVTVSPAFAGLKQIYMLAASAGGTNTGWQQRGTWTVLPSGPAAISVSPNIGAGSSQLFTLRYGDSNGAASLTSVRVRIGASNTGPATCTARYNPSTGALDLLDDAGAVWTSGTIGSGMLSNSQCTINLAGSSATISGTNLTLALEISFKSGFFGAKNVYMLAADAAATTGWQPRGTWTVPAAIVAVNTVAPNSGSGFTQDFTLQYSDSADAADLASARVRFGASNVSAGTCTASYNAATNAIALQNDAGTAWTTGTLGSGTLSNSQCTLNLTSSSASPNGVNLGLVLNITFAPAFSGAKNIYMLAKSSAGPSSGWQQRGTWTVPFAPRPTMLFLDSQPGDWVGQGKQFRYLPGTATFNAIRDSKGGITVSVFDSQTFYSWFLDFTAPNGAALQVGSYLHATSSFSTRFVGMHVEENGGCYELTGRFKVLEVAYDGSGNVQRFAIDFEQHCEDNDAALFGALRYNSTVTSVLPFDGNYPSYKLHITTPTGGRIVGTGIDCGNGGQACDLSLLSPNRITLTAIPDNGNLFGGWAGKCHGAQTIVVNVNTEEECSAVFVPVNSGQPATLLFLNSQRGDVMGEGAREVYAPPQSVFAASVLNNGRAVSITFDSPGETTMASWTLSFAAPDGQLLVPGDYPNTGEFLFPPAGMAGMEVARRGRACFGTGKFVVHEITITGATLASLALDFEQICGTPTYPRRPLIGSIRYNSAVPVTGSIAVTFTGHGQVTLSPSGTICLFDCTETAAIGTTYALSAQPDPGWSFAGWSGDADCADGALTLTAPTACHVTFQPTPAAAPSEGTSIGP